MTEGIRERVVGLVFDDRYLTHNTGLQLDADQRPFPFADPVPHPSGPGQAGRAKHLMDLYGLSDRMVRIAPVLASDEQLTVYHTPEYLDRVAAIAASDGGDTGSGAPIGRGGERIARLAAGGTIAAVDAVMTGQADVAYALVRPPGHHAMADLGMGFCVYNNAVIGARQAQRVHGAERVLILDWDVHHGNGTQAAFWADPSVLFISLHQDDLYPPGWGTVDQVGIGEGEGFTVNIPLPAGAGNRAYAEAFARIVEPVARQFRPDLVIVSAGQDANVVDPLGRMSLTLAAYRAMTKAMLAIADECCGGRLVVTQEGGYAPQYSPYCSAAIAETLVGGEPGSPAIEDPYGDRAETQPSSVVLGLDAVQAIDQVLEMQRRYWQV
ncbi:MAG: class II histone deacetylase [Thermomicrobiales bacterium]